MLHAFTEKNTKVDIKDAVKVSKIYSKVMKDEKIASMMKEIKKLSKNMSGNSKIEFMVSILKRKKKGEKPVKPGYVGIKDYKELSELLRKNMMKRLNVVEEKLKLEEKVEKELKEKGISVKNGKEIKVEYKDVKKYLSKQEYDAIIKGGGKELLIGIVGIEKVKKLKNDRWSEYDTDEALYYTGVALVYVGSVVISLGMISSIADAGSIMASGIVLDMFGGCIMNYALKSIENNHL
jgi:hypothetical protein